ncbi:MAG: hypothetical protein WA646_05840, partial [Candidatus Sulfotelmatobacter sp.]
VRHRPRRIRNWNAGFHIRTRVDARKYKLTATSLPNGDDLGNFGRDQPAVAFWQVPGGIGGTQRFTATSNYSDSTNSNLDASATWSSSKTGVASSLGAAVRLVVAPLSTAGQISRAS